MSQLLKEIEDSFKSAHVTDVRSGDTVRVHQRIKEGSKERVQVFEGLVIRTSRRGSSTFTIAVRRISSGVGVEKTFQPHSPLVEKIEVMKRSKVRRNNLSYMRERSGKSARLASVDFDSEALNAIPDVEEKPTKKTDNVEVDEEVKEAAEVSQEPKAAETKSDVTEPEAKTPKEDVKDTESDKTPKEA